MKTSITRKITLIFSALLLMSALSQAQGLGSIVGTVTDSTGAVVPAATVKATETRTNVSRTTSTNDQGYYVFSAMRPADYTVTVEAKGFRTTTTEAVTLLADQTLTLNAKLQVGTATEVVTVESTGIAVDTSTSTLKHVVESERLVELPLNGRNAAELTLQSAGAQSAPSGGADQGNTKTFPGAVTISANGLHQWRTSEPGQFSSRRGQQQ